MNELAIVDEGPYSFSTATGNGADTTFVFSFSGPAPGYIRKSDIYVYVRNSDVNSIEYNVWDLLDEEYLFPTSTSVTIQTVVPAPLDDVATPNIRVRRIMPKAEPYADVSTDNIFRKSVINNSFLQQLYTQHEVLDGFLSTDEVTRGHVNMGGYYHYNLGNGSEPDHSVNYGQLQEVKTDSEDSDIALHNRIDGLGPIEDDLQVVARALNVLDSDVIYDTDTVTPIPAYIYSASQQKTYVVPAGAIGETIISVVGNALLVQGGGTYEMTPAEFITATGSTEARSAEDRAADTRSLDDSGADSTGVDDASLAMATASALGNQKGLGDYLLSSSVNLANDLSYGSFNYTGIEQAFTTSGDNVHVSKVKVISTKHGIQHNTVPVENSIVSFSDFECEAYGLLYNDGSDGSSNGRIVFNNIRSATADAIELNNPSENSKNNLIVGNTLNGADGYITGGASGFCVGIAGVSGVITALNYGEGSAERSYHIEDLQVGNIQLGNVWTNCNKHGAYIIPQYESDLPTKSDGLISVANSFTQGGGNKALTNGIEHTWSNSTQGSLNNCVGVANYIKGFEDGISLPSREICYYGGNAIVDADFAVNTLNQNITIGDNIADNCTALVKGDYGAIVGGVHSKQQPVTIMDTGKLSAVQVGCAVKRFSFRMPLPHTGSGVYLDFPLFDTPTLMRGTITVIMSNATDNFAIVADLAFDGATLTTTNIVKKTSGNILGTISFNDTAGKINLRFGSVLTALNAMAIVDFDGVYYRDV